MIETKFKDTEVGRIPEDWELDKLKDKFEFRSNNTLSRDALSESGTIQDVHYGDVLIKYGSHLDVQKDEVPYITDKNYKASVYISDGDVIVADTAEDETVGKATEVINVGYHQLVSGLHTMWLHPIVQERYALGYLGYAFNANVYHNQLLPLMQGTKVTSVSKTAIKDTSILVPPKSEQTRIAKALSNIDTLISELGNLIEKKRAIKQGAMQQLLTGKKRLKGFSEPWVKSLIKDLYHVTRGYVLAMTKTDNHKSAKYPYPVFSSQTKDNGIAGYYSQYLYENAITWTTDGANAGDVKYRNGKFYCTNVCGVLLSDNGMANLCMAGILGLVSKSHVSYIGNPKLMNNTMAEIEIYHPSDVKEQIAISDILIKIDDEITSLEAKKAKYEQIKQGMMQQLLTGKIRLID